VTPEVVCGWLSHQPGLAWLFPAGGKQQQFAWDGGKVIAINKALLDEGYTAAGETQL
jgi:hypothetical protein